MSATSTPTPAPGSNIPKTNHAGLTVIDYRGSKTTLCAGCGHNAITERLIDAMYEMGVQPENLAKLSGIGCSSKSPAYFMQRAHLDQRQGSVDDVPQWTQYLFELRTFHLLDGESRDHYMMVRDSFFLGLLTSRSHPFLGLSF